MKKQTVTQLIFLLTTSLFFFSCGNNMNKNKGALEFDSIQVNETAHLFGDTAKPACNLVINLSFASQSSDARLKDSLNTYFISVCLGDKYTTMQPEEAVNEYTRKYISDYRSDLESLYQKESNDSSSDVGAWYSYYKYIQSHVQFYAKDLLIYRYRYEEYTGGAHGIYMTSFLNIDLRTLSPIRLDNLFAEGYEEALTDLLWNQLMAMHKVTSREELEEMGYASTGELAPTENFYLSKEGITFYYNVYDIAPYVMGAIEISLPWEMLQHLLKEDLTIINSVK